MKELCAEFVRVRDKNVCVCESGVCESVVCKRVVCDNGVCQSAECGTLCGKVVADNLTCKTWCVTKLWVTMKKCALQCFV